MRDCGLDPLSRQHQIPQPFFSDIGYGIHAQRLYFDAPQADIGPNPEFRYAERDGNRLDGLDRQRLIGIRRRASAPVTCRTRRDRAAA